MDERRVRSLVTTLTTGSGLALVITGPYVLLIEPGDPVAATVFVLFGALLLGIGLTRYRTIG